MWDKDRDVDCLRSVKIQTGSRLIPAPRLLFFPSGLLDRVEHASTLEQASMKIEARIQIVADVPHP